MSDHRYDVGFYIGPCSEKEAEALAEAILDLPEFGAVGGGGVAMQIVTADDPNFAGSSDDD
jgi:hypothetical protein